MGKKKCPGGQNIFLTEKQFNNEMGKALLRQSIVLYEGKYSLETTKRQTIKINTYADESSLFK